MRYAFVVLPQQVFAEIILQIAPNGVDVIGIILRVVIFHQEGRTLNAVIMGLAAFETADASWARAM